MKDYTVNDFSALIGIDWADQKHDVCEMASGSGEYHSSVISSQPKALHDWAVGLKARYPNKPVAVACELKKGPLIYALSKYDHIVIFPMLKFFIQHNARYPNINEQRIQAIKSAQALNGVIDPNRILVEALVPQLKVLIKAIDRIDQEIKTRYNAQNEHVIFDSLPGAGPQLAPRLLAAFGTDRDRFQSAAELQKYAGIAPVVEESGQKRWTHWRYSCPKFLRQTFVEWAGLSIRYSFWAKAYYELQISKGKHHNAAVRALAFKWIRIVFRCWQSNTLR